MRGFTFGFRIRNSGDTNTLKAAQSDENIKSSKSKRLSRFYSAHLNYILIRLLNTYRHTESQ